MGCSLAQGWWPCAVLPARASSACLAPLLPSQPCPSRHHEQASALLHQPAGHMAGPDALQRPEPAEVTSSAKTKSVQLSAATPGRGVQGLDSSSACGASPGLAAWLWRQGLQPR